MASAYTAILSSSTNGMLAVNVSAAGFLFFLKKEPKAMPNRQVRRWQLGWAGTS